MNFSTIITLVIYVFMFRLVLSSATLLSTKLLVAEYFKYNLKWLNNYMVRKSAYKMVLTLCYVIVLNVVESLNYPISQSTLLVLLLVLIELTVFIYYELPSYSYSEIKRGLGAWHWLIV